jgi:hypothetical protein
MKTQKLSTYCEIKVIRQTFLYHLHQGSHWDDNTHKFVQEIYCKIYVYKNVCVCVCVCVCVRA